MKSVVIGIPLREGLDSNFMKALMPLLQNPRLIPDTDVDVLLIEGPSVNFARNTIASVVLKSAATDLVFIDADMDWSIDRLARLLAHDADIVGGYYTRRKLGPAKWLFIPKPGAEVQPSGLLECTALATGFLRIKAHVFRKIQELFPEHSFNAKDDANEMPKVVHDWFRMGVVGPDTAESKLNEIKKAVRESQNDSDTLDEIENILDRVPKPGRLLGEDFFFTKIARKAGFQAYVDLGMPIMGHYGLVPHPVTPEMVGYDPAKGTELPPAEEI